MGRASREWFGAGIHGIGGGGIFRKLFGGRWWGSRWFGFRLGSDERFGLLCRLIPGFVLWFVL